MASQTSSMVKKENNYSLRAKGIEGVKEKKAKVLAALKGSTLKRKSSLRGGEKIKKAPKTFILTDEELKRCDEWSKEGIEKVYFTGTDQQKLDRDAIEKCVKEEFGMVMSCMSEWNQVLYDCVTPVKEIAADTGDILRLELEPEVLLPELTSSLTSGFEVDPIFEEEEPEILWPPFMGGFDFELKLKEDYEDNAAF